MTHEKWQTPLCAAGVAFLVAFGGVSCVATAFALPVEITMIAVCCAIAAVVFAALVRLRLGLIPLCIGALLLGYLWQRGELSISAETLLFQISDMYNRGYGWEIIRWSDRELTDATVALCVVGACLAAAVGSLLVWGRAGWLAILTGILPLASCMVLTDTVPQEWCLFTMLLGQLLILLTGRVRKRAPRQGNRLTFLLTVPVCLALALLFTMAPREGYQGHLWAQKLEDTVKAWFEDPLDKVDIPQAPLYPGAGGEDEDATRVQLDAVGPKDELWSMVMKVKGRETGYLYLRGCIYNNYDGKTWTFRQSDGWPGERYNTTGKHYQLKIATHKLHGVLYDTYTPVNYRISESGRKENPEGLTEYTVDYVKQVTYDDSWEQLVDGTVAYQQNSQYLKLPWEASKWARGVLVNFEEYGEIPTNAADAWHLAQKIVDYVQQSAVYDLNTPQMPEEETDFASWFMEESDTGYCVHFATAAAVLLREAGIPARYVTGYLVKTVKDQQVTVRQKDAHAWVECYIAGVGWIAMEPTPGMTRTGADTPPPTTPPETQGVATEPVETEPAITTTIGQTTAPKESTQTAPEIPGGDGTQSRTVSLMIPLIGILTLAAMVFQWRLRVWLGQKKMRSGKANRRALARWREIERISRLLKVKPGEDVHELAQKARFSRHVLTVQELKRMDAWLDDAKKQLRKKSVLHQLVYTVVLAIY